MIAGLPAWSYPVTTLFIKLPSVCAASWTTDGRRYGARIYLATDGSITAVDHGHQRDEHRGAAAPDEPPQLSTLERALRQALDSIPRDQVVKCILSVLPTSVFVAESGRLHVGKVRKVSVSMPEELAEAVRARTGAGGFSRYVTEAVDREIRHDLLGELIGELEAEYGPVPQELLDEARREWPDFEEE